MKDDEPTITSGIIRKIPYHEVHKKKNLKFVLMTGTSNGVASELTSRC